MDHANGSSRRWPCPVCGYPELDARARTTVDDLLANWRKKDGSFRSRRLLLGWDNVPMHRWAQAQIFRSLCLLRHSADRADSEAADSAGAPHDGARSVA